MVAKNTMNVVMWGFYALVRAQALFDMSDSKIFGKSKIIIISPLKALARTHVVVTPASASMTLLSASYCIME